MEKSVQGPIPRKWRRRRKVRKKDTCYGYTLALQCQLSQYILPSPIPIKILILFTDHMLQCKYCGKAFASHAAHDSHVRRTHARDKPVTCHICGESFGQSYDLKFHLKLHQGEWHTNFILFMFSKERYAM